MSDWQLRTGDLVLVKFHPSYNNELKKYRPALVLLSTEDQLDSRFVTVIPFTSETVARRKAELLIESSALEKPSLLLCWYFLTIDKQRVVKKIGRLDTTQLSAVLKTTRQLFK